ncbi:hypothetical protein C1752_01325 [Acaryochloris thomasi RCC1774]|uniref:CENP-V/GFA domain-containing protein n=1 Tax=Acaryochloris thomasi RCC1774 TaxID=1764569 RepID=A0A2W1JM55_9CYAN|nr:GFA family protein [Acaryochloris thomasi]PZD74379.1 hypothetical protein C1752_01325 [Acaryochloris thomasi RCC1774]
MRYQGSCHCGALQFEVEAAEDLVVQECNCSMCSKVGYLHLIVPKEKFNLLKGQDNITTYTFNTGVAKHTFCKICGVKPFYTPRSNPDGVSINFRCLSPQPRNVRIEPFDGQNWEANAAGLAHLSQFEEP